MTGNDWWKSGVVYQIYPRSFQDSNNDGVGDIQGIIQRLDHISALGVDAIWLSPFFSSPQIDFGYDISDYRKIDPIFGSISDFKELREKTKALKIKLILDGVFNHTSDRHPWFLDSMEGSKRDWYIWRKEIPNNWASVFGGKAWTQINGQHYLHTFAAGQPDLNWRNPKVVEAILEVMRHWLDLGVDGFRLDVFNCYLKDRELRSNPKRRDTMGRVGGIFFPYIGQEHLHDRDNKDLLDVLKKMRDLIDEKPGRVLIGETMDERFIYDNAAQYCGPEKLQLAFHFGLLHSKWGARPFRKAIRTWTNALPEQAWPTWVLSNHDFPRISRRWGKNTEKLKLLALMQMTLRGTPFIYNGDELGMRDGQLRRNEIQDPPGKKFWPFFKGRDGCRTPMQWDETDHAGFSNVRPWLRVNSDHQELNMEEQIKREGSVLRTYQEVIHLRKNNRVLQNGEMKLPDMVHRKVLSYLRQNDNEQMQIVLNMSKFRTEFELSKNGTQLYSTKTSKRIATVRKISLEPYEGCVFKLKK